MKLSCDCGNSEEMSNSILRERMITPGHAEQYTEGKLSRFLIFSHYDPEAGYQAEITCAKCWRIFQIKFVFKERNGLQNQ